MSKFLDLPILSEKHTHKGVHRCTPLYLKKHTLLHRFLCVHIVSPLVEVAPRDVKMGYPCFQKIPVKFHYIVTIVSRRERAFFQHVFGILSPSHFALI